MAMIAIEKETPFSDIIKLKRSDFYKKLSNHAIETYNLLQLSHIVPNKIEQCLDFTFNPTLHTCNPCLKPRSEIKIEEKKQSIKLHDKQEEDSNENIFITEPRQVIFENYDLNEQYTVCDFSTYLLGCQLK